MIGNFYLENFLKTKVIREICLELAQNDPFELELLYQLLTVVGRKLSETNSLGFFDEMMEKYLNSNELDETIQDLYQNILALKEANFEEREEEEKKTARANARAEKEARRNM